jgi:uncharacterized membrane protein YkgB
MHGGPGTGHGPIGRPTPCTEEVEVAGQPVNRKEQIVDVDRRIIAWMWRHGHYLDRWAIGLVFIWFGMLKVFEFTSATSIIAETVYIGDPASTVRVLGLWEAVIGLCLLVLPLARVAIALLVIRLPGTLLALFVKADVCWTDTALVPTIQGQYLIKDSILFTAALVIGGGLHREATARD